MSLQGSSSFRRSGTRDERRRRLLADELSNSSDDWSAPGGPIVAAPQRSEHYGDAEFLQQQIRLLDLVPRRAVTFVLVLLLAAAILAGLEASYGWMLDRVSAGGRSVAALDLAAKGSLGCWFCSLMLLAASVTALLIYSVRRYRTDDYRGRYRIWRWAAACWLLMATDEAASLRDGLRELMTSMTGTPLLGDGSLWWVIVYVLILGAIGSRLLLDMRSDPFAMGILVVAGIAATTAIMGQLGLILPEPDSRRIMVSSGAAMLGGLALLMAMLLHARHVLRDAEGLLPRCRQRAAEESVQVAKNAKQTTLAPSATGDWKKVDPPHAIPQPAFQRAAAPAIAAATAPASSASASSPINHKLTKAERRALKKHLMRERMERTGR